MKCPKQELTLHLFWLCPLLFLLTLLWHTWWTPDIWMHLYRGQLIDSLKEGLHPASSAFVMKGDVGFYWLFEWLVFKAYSLDGMIAVNILFGLVWCLTFTLMLFVSRVVKGGSLGMLWLLGAALVMHMRFQERPEVFSYLFVMIFITTLQAYQAWWQDKKKAKHLFLILGITQILWANMHGFFILGPALVGLAMLTDLGSRLLARSDLKRPMLAWSALLLLLFLLNMVSPFGWKNYYWFFAHAEQLSGLKEFISEFRSPFFDEYRSKFFAPHRVGMLIYLGFVIILGVAHLRRYQIQHAFAFCLALTGIFLALWMNRFSPFLVILSCPLLGIFFNSRPLGPWPKIDRSIGYALCLISLGLAYSVVKGDFYEFENTSLRFGLGSNKQAYPQSMAQFLCQNPPQGRLFNEAEDGGYLAFHCPQLKLYGHSLHTDSAWSRRYIQSSKPEVFFELDREQQFSAAVLDIRKHFDLLVTLLGDEDWNLVTIEPCRILLARNSSGMQAADPKSWRFIDPTITILRQPPHTLCTYHWTIVAAQTNRMDILFLLLDQMLEYSEIHPQLITHLMEGALVTGNQRLADYAVRLGTKAYYIDEKYEARLKSMTEDIRRAFAWPE